MRIFQISMQHLKMELLTLKLEESLLNTQQRQQVVPYLEEKKGNLEMIPTPQGEKNR